MSFVTDLGREEVLVRSCGELDRLRSSTTGRYNLNLLPTCGSQSRLLRLELIYGTLLRRELQKILNLR